MKAMLRFCAVPFGLIAAVSPASAQWTRVTALPATSVFSLFTNGDTLAAGMDTTVFVSTDAGASWTHSRRPVAGVTSIQAVRIRDGRLYAGTFGQGVFVSDDLGATWQDFNQGLVGGVFDSQLDLSDLQVRGDSLYAATEGAGVFARGFTAKDAWNPFGSVFEPNQASNVNALAVGGTRLLACGGSNGEVFIRDPADAEWNISDLGNTGLLPGVQAESAVFNGSGWVVGTIAGVFHSPLGQSPWALTPLGLNGVRHSAFAARGRHLFAAFDVAPTAVVIEHSADDGASWQMLETLPNVFVFQLAMVGTDLFAGRGDGLWRRSTATVSVSDGEGSGGLRFAILGRQPVGDDVRFAIDLPERGVASLDLFDVAGRRVGDRVQWSLEPGTQVVSVSAARLAAGVYEARLSAGDRQRVLRLVHVR